MCQVAYSMLWIFLGSRRMETAPTSIEVLLRPTQSQSDEPSDLRGSLSPTSVYSTWQSQAVTHPVMNRARRCLTSVIEHKPLSERRIPYSLCRRKAPSYYLNFSDKIASLCWEWVCCHHCLVQVVYKHLFHVCSESVIWVFSGYVSQVASTRSTVDKTTGRRQLIL